MERNLFQILITEGDGEPPLPNALLANVASLRAAHPDHAYHRLNGAALDAFIGANFDTETLHAYRTLRPFAYKADLGRLALLLVHGGIYADMSMRILRPIELPADKRMFCWRDLPGYGLWSVNNSLLAARAGAEAFRRAIELIVANVRTGYYGDSPLHPTGPALLGRALALTDRSGEIASGTYACLTNDGNPHNIGYTDAAGRIVAVRMKVGRFVDLGIPGTNQYPELWAARMIYGEPLRFAHDDPRLQVPPATASTGARREAGGIVFEPATTGYLVYGPYVDLQPGRYRADYALAPGAAVEGLTIDVVTGDVVVSRTVEASESGRISIAFRLDQACGGVQVRLISAGGAHGAILGLSIAPD